MNRKQISTYTAQEFESNASKHSNLWVCINTVETFLKYKAT